MSELNKKGEQNKMPFWG